jgi:hypothetical protein
MPYMVSQETSYHSMQLPFAPLSLFYLSHSIPLNGLALKWLMYVIPYLILSFSRVWPVKIHRAWRNTWQGAILAVVGGYIYWASLIGQIPLQWLILRRGIVIIFILQTRKVILIKKIRLPRITPITGSWKALRLGNERWRKWKGKEKD